MADNITLTSSGEQAAPAAGTSTQAITPAAAPAHKSVYDRYFEQIGRSPSEPEPAEPVADPDPAESAAARGAEALVRELGELRASIAELRANGNNAAANAAEQKVKGFLDYIQAGDPAGAESALAAKLEAQISSRVIGEATRRALAVANAQSELAAYGQRLLAENPDLAPVQDLIEQTTQALIQRARAEGKIPEGDIGSYVSAYKSALRQSVDRFRGFGAARAGAGAQSANARTTDVLRAGTVPPSTQNNSASTPEAISGINPVSQAEQAASDQAWLAARKAKQFGMRNMG